MSDFLFGLLMGTLVYCATTFPAAALFDLTGGTWGGVCMLWGFMCGTAGIVGATS